MEREKLIKSLEERTGVSREVLSDVPTGKLSAYFDASAAVPSSDTEVAAKFMVFLGALPCAQGDWFLGLPIIALGVDMAVTARRKQAMNDNLGRKIRDDRKLAAPAPKAL